MGALNDLIDDFLASLDVEKGYSRNTLDAYARDLADFAAFLEEKGRADISRVDVEEAAL
jgi:integrase/recombinase XerD